MIDLCNPHNMKVCDVEAGKRTMGLILRYGMRYLKSSENRQLQECSMFVHPA
jgi:hypothetical protein